MRTNIRTSIAIVFTAALVLTVSCKGKTEEAKETSTEATMEHEGHDMDGMDHEGHDMNAMETADMQGKAYTSKYVCVMHCEGSGSETEGKCPVCGMAYVLNEEHMADGHTHN